MSNQPNIDLPMYKKIALDIATRIHKKEFEEGKRIYGRSTMASEYHVSTETIRRAMALLRDMEVVEVQHGSGVYVKSIERAYAFIEKYHNKESIKSLRKDIKRLLKQKRDIEEQIYGIIEKIIDYSDRLKNINPINPVEISLEDNSHLIGRTISETKFWQNAGATIIGIRRDDQIILSPGPYMGFEEGDIILAIGDMDIIERTKEFMREKSI